MHTISIYNNKGGVGKSTLTLFMADFLASIRVGGQPLRVLVMDLDAQGSSAIALLGLDVVTQAREDRRTIGHLAMELQPNQTPDLENFLVWRSTANPHGKNLPEVAVLLPERESIFDFECNPLQQLTLMRQSLRPALEQLFDMVLVDLPGNIDQRHLLSINALVMSDSVVVPVEPSRISLNAMPDTLKMIHYAREKSGSERPAFLGLILNRTDRRSRQFRLHGHGLKYLFDQDGSPWFTNFLPNAPALASATDDSLAFGSLKERYGSYYPHVKRVVKELFNRWQALEVQQNKVS